MSTQRPQPQRPVKTPNPRTPITRSGPQPKFGGGNESPDIKKSYEDWKKQNRGVIPKPVPKELFPPTGQKGGKTRRRKGRKSKRAKRSHKKTRNTRKKSKSHRKRR